MELLFLIFTKRKTTTMKTISLTILFSLLISPLFGQYSKEDQINMAVLAAPEAVRAGAHVYGFDTEGKFVTLREGTNDWIVRSDNPKQAGFEVVCYKKDVEPFMARGRELRAEGKNRAELFKIREDEMHNGTLQKPNQGSTLHIYYGSDAKYNPETKEIEGASYRYVVYMPLATQESTGLPLKPNGPGHPWLMFPGLYRAHIMITPPAGK